MEIKNKEYFQFEVRDSSVKIKKYTGDTKIKKLTIPSKINGNPVVSISDISLDDCKEIESLSLPENLTYIDQNIMSSLKKLKCIIINNPDIEVDCDTFITNTELKYIILHRKLYNKMSKDVFPGISGKTGLDKYGINPFITQMIPFGKDYLSVSTSNNFLKLYQMAINDYNSKLDLFQKIKIIFTNSFNNLFDKDGNSPATIHAYNYIKENIREALSESDALIVNFLFRLANAIGYNDYNSFETFDDKINESLYIMFVNAIENNRMSVLRDWIDMEFKRYDSVHMKRNERMVIFYNHLIILLAKFFYKIEMPSDEDLQTITAFFFSKPSIENKEIENLINYINAINTERDIDFESDDTKQAEEIYSFYSEMDFDDMVSTVILWGFCNEHIGIDEVIDFYYPIDDLKNSEDSHVNNYIETISSALKNRVGIDLVMKTLQNLQDNDGKFDVSTIESLKCMLNSHISTNNSAKTSQSKPTTPDFNSASLVQHF